MVKFIVAVKAQILDSLKKSLWRPTELVYINTKVSDLVEFTD